jgi:hypothetical protein
MPLDFSLLGNGIQFDNVLKAYDSGRADRKERETTNALAMYATDPEGGIAAIRKVNPTLAIELQDDYAKRTEKAQTKAVFQEADPVKRQAAAVATGSPEVISAVASMDATQRAHAKELTDAAGGALVAMRTKFPPEKRREIWSQLPAEQRAILVGPEHADDFDPSDENIDAKITELQGFHGALEQANKDREFKANQDKANKPIVVPPGARVFDPRAGKEIYAAPNRPFAPRTGRSSAAPNLPPGFVLD